jgi:N-formylglutamate deformylase
MILMKNKMPVLISVPHAGDRIPPEVEDICILNKQQIIKDGDVGASEVYDIEDEVANCISTKVARAIVDLNRSPDDRRKDGVIKTHTCWDEPVYEKYPSEETIKMLLEKYYYPYHTRLTELASSSVFVGIDCHTMAEKGPPVAPDAGLERPWICLSNGDGTCPDKWLNLLGKCMSEEFNGNVSLNKPFKGGYIVRTHSVEMPWIQLELSRAPFMTNMEKREKVLAALKKWLNYFP